MAYSFERIFRNAQDTILFAVMIDNGKRHVMIMRWETDDVVYGVLPSEAMGFWYEDQTDRPRAFAVAADIARHLSRARLAEANDVLAKSKFRTREVET